MIHGHETSRQFWHDFDHHFRYEAVQNGFLDSYKELGGDAAAADAWRDSRAAGNYPESFRDFAEARRSAIEHLANAQMGYFESRLTSEDQIIEVFQDFAFGVLESTDAEHRANADDTRHTMSGGVYSEGYRHWHGFAEAALALGLDPDFWTFLLKVNGMAWELHVKSHPNESDPHDYKRLSPEETKAITDKWMSLSREQIAAEFDKYVERTEAWLEDAI